jgi:7-carboxy-7-deazaguanine synthase
MNLPISEIFYSLQGEGLRTGTANTFVRIQGCKAQHACYAQGIRCDTEFTSGTDYTLDEIHDMIQDLGKGCMNIIWTGGEPADRVDKDVVKWFKDKGYYQCIETSGLFPVTDLLDYVTISPKVAEHVIAKNFKHVDELRYVRHKGQSVPVPTITADSYCISPHSDGMDINTENLQHCIQLCLDNPEWRLSVQNHKIWMVL